MRRFWLWVWLPHSKIKNGWDFGTRDEALAYFNCHFREEPVKYEITLERI